ncbi:MAG TPA: 30S ribosome-binding factor RbfA [Clostridiales bacterium]|nr:30S ribosome-binding factor RbfA [Clostridia bacterium]MDD4680752.1 30S ribosome-binding factor RbfA [Clostridia bacterium]HCS75755.1 30S ribosome-binding factor RbfA [Clostridiales bacterium]
MAKYRINRISEEIRREISDIIRSSVKDPRVSQVTSVVKAEVAGDLRYAKIYISVLGSEEDREATMEGLKKAAGFIRRELGNRLDIRYTPELQFVSDHSIEYSVEINKKLNELNIRQDDDDVY